MEPQHTPAPQESRGIYGFVLFVLMNCCTFCYFVWMGLPTDVLESLPYEPPQQYWGLAVPIFLCTLLFLFAFCIYPALHGLQDGEMDDVNSFRDEHSLPHDYFQKQREKSRKKIKQIPQQRASASCNLKPVPPVSDLELDDVCQLLYLNH